jgi:5-oxoprolinase (ATP-hydrolysing) subunit A
MRSLGFDGSDLMLSSYAMVDLNADLGEGGEQDEALLGLVTSANIACGGHAGSEEMMRRSIQSAIAAGVAIGAHPGYEDRENFGRREMNLSVDEVVRLVKKQVGNLAEIARNAGAELHHVKPHGALYHQANSDEILAAAVVKGIREVSPKSILYAPPMGALADAGRAAGLVVWAEGFADRRYRADGSLVPRIEPGAVISNIPEAVDQATSLIRARSIDTLCVHGDGAQAVEMLRAIRMALFKQ